MGYELDMEFRREHPQMFLNSIYTFGKKFNCKYTWKITVYIRIWLKANHVNRTEMLPEVYKDF